MNSNRTNNLWGLVRDGMSRPLRLDASTHAIETIAYAHHEIHAGSNFLVQEGFVLNNATRDYLINAPNSDTECHITINVTGSQDTLVNLQEGVTHTGATRLRCVNRNRRSKKVAETIISRGVNGPQGNSMTLGSARWGIATAAGGRGGGGGADVGRHEIILARNTKYLLSITALSANVNNITVDLDFYEHSAKD